MSELELEETVDDVMAVFAPDFRDRLHSAKKRKSAWVPRRRPMADIALPFSGGIRRGKSRCAAIGLLRGDCQEAKSQDGLYCYYHTKVVSGLVSVPEELYPVWPLPPQPWQFAWEIAA